jgi:hypothetical protein
VVAPVVVVVLPPVVVEVLVPVVVDVPVLVVVDVLVPVEPDVELPPVLLVDVLDVPVVACSHSTQKTFCFSPPEVIGRVCFANSL